MPLQKTHLVFISNVKAALFPLLQETQNTSLYFQTFPNATLKFDLAMAALNRLWTARPSTPISSVAASTIRTLSSCSAANSGPDLEAPSLLAQNPLPLCHGPKDRSVHWAFLGCPGVGKGTYASRLSHLLAVPHIATGDLVREELSSSGPLASQVPRVPFNLSISVQLLLCNINMLATQLFIYSLIYFAACRDCEPREIGFR